MEGGHPGACVQLFCYQASVAVEQVARWSGAGVAELPSLLLQLLLAAAAVMLVVGQVVASVLRRPEG
eukprot:829065-Amphidinium_carterae.2